jgi:hypothetical protein
MVQEFVKDRTIILAHFTAWMVEIAFRNVIVTITLCATRFKKKH